MYLKVYYTNYYDFDVLFDYFLFATFNTDLDFV